MGGWRFFWRCHGLPQSQAARRKPDARRRGPADTIYGDAGVNLLDGAVGGDDTLTTYGAGNVYGDAGKNIVGYARGGNDGVAAFIVAATAFPVTVNLFGDAGGAIPPGAGTSRMRRFPTTISASSTSTCTGTPAATWASRAAAMTR